MKITIYELLGMIKDGKSPKRIRFLNHYYIWKENDEDYQREDGLMLFGDIKINYILNSEVEIIEEEKKIPEKLPYYSLEKIQKAKNKDEWREERISLLEKRVEDLHIKMNELLDYLKSKGE